MMDPIDDYGLKVARLNDMARLMRRRMQMRVMALNSLRHELQNLILIIQMPSRD